MQRLPDQQYVQPHWEIPTDSCITKMEVFLKPHKESPTTTKKITIGVLRLLLQIPKTAAALESTRPW
jgi:hypothetical protein